MKIKLIQPVQAGLVDGVPNVTVAVTWRPSELEADRVTLFTPHQAALLAQALLVAANTAAAEIEKSHARIVSPNGRGRD